MSIVSMNVSFESALLLSQMDKNDVIHWLEEQGYICLLSEDASKYINFEKSIGTTEFYHILSDAIESGKLSLELLVGSVVTKKLVQSAEHIISDHIISNTVQPT